MAALFGHSHLWNLSADDYSNALQMKLGEDFIPICWATGILMLLISPITIVANGFIIMANLIDPLKNIKKTPSSNLILSLALSDFMVGIVFGPLTGIWFVYFAVNRESPFSVTVLAVNSVVVAVSVFVLLSLSVDRYIAVTTPLRYSSRVTNKKTRIASGCIWAYSVILGVLVALLKNRFQLTGLIVSAHIQFTFLVLSALYITVVISLRKHARRMKQTSSSANSTPLKNAYERERRVTKTVIIVITIFKVTFLPYIILSVLLFECVVCMRQVLLMAWLYHLAAVMVNVNSLVNPFLYGWSLPKYRQALKHLLWKRKDTNSKHTLYNSREKKRESKYKATPLDRISWKETRL